MSTLLTFYCMRNLTNKVCVAKILIIKYEEITEKIPLWVGKQHLRELILDYISKIDGRQNSGRRGLKPYSDRSQLCKV